MATIPVCPGNITAGMDGSLLCDSAWTWMDASVIPIPFDYSQVDPLVIAEMFTSGFVLVGSIWLVARVVAIILSMIRS